MILLIAASLVFIFTVTTPDGLLQVTIDSETMAECQQKHASAVAVTAGKGYVITECRDKRYEIPKESI
jgi:hypothetical protein